jgi:hypothetical protein
MMKALIACEWTVIDGAHAPALLLIQQPGDSVMDVTGQPSVPTSPNTCTVEVWGADTIAAAQADNRFLVLQTWEG